MTCKLRKTLSCLPILLQTEAPVPQPAEGQPAEPPLAASATAPTAAELGAGRAVGSFVRVHGTVFVDDDCREYHHTGWNGCGSKADTAAYCTPLP